MPEVRSPIGFVVAGGKSERMGRDKALLPWRGTTLIEHALLRLRVACGEARVLCGPDRRYHDLGVDVHVDLQPGSGPLGAVLTGLEVSPRGLGLFLAVDLPNVPMELLAFLLARSEGWDAVVPVHRRGEEPLCAVYASSCLAPVRRRLAAGDLKMTSFWPEVRVRTVTEAEIGAFGDPDHLFRNLNGPGDLEGSD